LREICVARTADEATLALHDLRALIEELQLRSVLHLLHEGAHRRGLLGQILAVERALRPCVEQTIDERERNDAARAELAAAEEEARREAQDVEAPRADQRVVEIVGAEDRGAMLLARRRAGALARRHGFRAAERIG